MTSQFSCVYGVSRAIVGIEDGIAHRTLGRGFSFLLTPGTKGLIYWFLFAKMERTYQSLHIPRFNKDELEAHIGRYFEQEVAPNIRLKTVYHESISCHYAPLEEATYEYWTWKRFACIGDSIHKASTFVKKAEIQG